MVHTLKLGGLYLDDKAAAPGTKYKPGQAISFENASGEEVSWVPAIGLLIADRCLLTKISWNDLDSQSLVFGKEIELCGFRFRARLLKVGGNEGVPNEWDAALDVVGENDDFWHWDEVYFWGQETPAIGASYRANRGYDSARFWNWSISSRRYALLGFRPVLEPLHTAPSALRQGKKILVIGRDGCVVGKLVEKTRYDLVLQPESDGLVGKAAFAADMQDGTVAVDRGGILSITTA